MFGTIVNCIAVIAGSLIGIIINSGIDKKLGDAILKVLGLASLFIGLSTALGGLLNENAEAVLFIVSLVLGTVVGEKFDIEGKMDSLGDRLQKAMGGRGGNVSQGFVTASLTFCVGTMSVLGALESGLNGNHAILFAKSVLDFTSAMIFASTMGIGVMFAAVTILVYQGGITLFSAAIGPFITADMLREISIVGGIMIFAIGCNLADIKKFKVANMLPALLVPVIYYLPFVTGIIEGIKNIF
jgi:uncharacterized membrane protein YqgA involved in biofilm formation